MKQLLISLAILLLTSCFNNQNHEKNDLIPSEMTYKVTGRYPHDTASYTEGFLVHNGQFYESTGGQQQLDTFKSWYGPVDLATGRAIKKVMLDTSYFGEGISILNGNIYQLTYKGYTGFVYNASTYEKIKEFKYNGEGWALTNDGTNLIMSNGSSILQYLDPLTLQVVKTLNVQDNNGPVGNINELEFINNHIYANQYLTNYILKIEPRGGNVVGKADLSKLAEEAKQKYADLQEMNGIAYDSATQKIYVTGKAWPYVYEVKFD